MKHDVFSGGRNLGHVEVSSRGFWRAFALGAHAPVGPFVCQRDAEAWLLEEARGIERHRNRHRPCPQFYADDAMAAGWQR